MSETITTRHHRPRPRPLDDPPQLGGLGRRTTRPRASPCSPRPTPASRSRSRRCARTPTSSPTSPCPRPSTTWPRVIESVDDAADHHGPLLRRHPHPAAAGPRPRLGRRGHRLRAHRGRPGQPALPGQVAVPGAEEPGQPAQGGRLHRRGVPLRLHQHPRARRTRRRSGTATRSPRPGNWVWAYGLIANFKPGHQETWVDYDADRAPLLFIGGEKDHIMPPSVNKSNAKHYKKSPAADRVLRVRGPRPLDLRRAGLGGRRRPRPRLGARARVDRAPSPATRDLIGARDGGPPMLTAHPRRRADRPARARRLAHPHRPDLRPARAPVRVRLGDLVHQDRRPGAWRSEDVGPVDVVLLSHDHHADNLDDLGRALLPTAPTVVTTRSGARRLGSPGRPRTARPVRRPRSTRRAGRR